MEDYRHILLRDAIRIDRVVNASRLEIDRQYAFEGESHDFWEFQYAALGSAYIYTKNDFYELKQGQITFFRPGKFHVLYGNGKRPAELWVFSFRCASPLMEKFDELLMTVSDECRALMERIVEETHRSFEVTPHPADGRILRRKASAAFGCEQLIKNRLEELMLLLFRSRFGGALSAEREAILPHREPAGPAEEMRACLLAHTHSTLSLEQLARTCHLSVTYAKKLYRTEYGVSPMADFHRMKLREAKKVLRTTDLPIREVASLFDFKSICYFSNFFKKHTGMNPHSVPRRPERRGAGAVSSTKIPSAKPKGSKRALSGGIDRAALGGTCYVCSDCGRKISCPFSIRISTVPMAAFRLKGAVRSFPNIVKRSLSSWS